MRVPINDLKDHSDQKVEVKGSVHRIRELGGISFVLLRDLSGMVQLVFGGKVGFTQESVLAVKGTVQKKRKSAPILCDWALKEKGVEAVFVYAFPRKKRPFYAYPDGQKTGSFDLLFRGLEITTGGRRIHQYDMLLDALPKSG